MKNVVAPSFVTIDLDGRPRALDASSWRLWLQRADGGAVTRDVAPDAKLRWSALDALPELRELAYDGTDTGLVAYVASRPSLKHLMWSGHDCADVDLRGSRLEQLGIDPTARRFVVRVPKAGTLRELRIRAPRVDGALHVVVDDAREGRGLTITLFGARSSAPTRIEGVPKLEALRHWFANEVDAREVARFRELRELEIMGDPTCAMSRCEKLAALAELRVLVLRNAYDVDAATLPAREKLRALERVEIDGVRAANAAAMRARFDGVARFSMRGVRSEKWLRENLDNPFREWSDEYGARVGAAAAKAWKTASRAIEALGARATAPKIEAMLRAFVAAFNALDAKPGLDTIQVEQVSDAYDALVASANAACKRAPSDAKARSCSNGCATSDSAPPRLRPGLLSRLHSEERELRAIVADLAADLVLDAREYLARCLVARALLDDRLRALGLRLLERVERVDVSLDTRDRLRDRRVFEEVRLPREVLLHAGDAPRRA
jgi:hypothetical protein